MDSTVLSMGFCIKTGMLFERFLCTWTGQFIVCSSMFRP